jgi:hypothetical protein
MFLSDMENVRIKKLKKQAPEEIPLFLKAAGIFETIDGLSITGDRQKLEQQIEKILDFRPATKDRWSRLESWNHLPLPERQRLNLKRGCLEVEAQITFLILIKSLSRKRRD